MRNSYPFKIGTKLDNSVCPDYRPDGRVRPGHLAGLQTDHFFTHLAWAQERNRSIKRGSARISREQELILVIQRRSMIVREEESIDFDVISSIALAGV
jgi:hypothetical protein